MDYKNGLYDLHHYVQNDLHTTVLESPFNKVKGLKACNFIKKRLKHRLFPAKFVKR